MAKSFKKVACASGQASVAQQVVKPLHAVVEHLQALNLDGCVGKFQHTRIGVLEGQRQMLFLEFAGDILVRPKFVRPDRVINDVAAPDVIGGQPGAGKDAIYARDHVLQRRAEFEVVQRVRQAGGDVLPR